MIVAIFQTQNFNDQILQLIISKIHNFTQELNLFNVLCEECDPSVQKKINEAYAENHMDIIIPKEKYEALYSKHKSKYHSIDVSAAASVWAAYEKEIRISRDPSYPRTEPIMPDEEYKEYLKEVIPLMIKDYYKLKTSDYKGIEFMKNYTNDFCRKYNIAPFTFTKNRYSADTIIFEMYILPEIDRVISKHISEEELSEEILNKIDKLFEKSNDKYSEMVKSEYYEELSKKVDELLIAPFRQLHKTDMEELKKRIAQKQSLDNNL